MSNNRRVLTKEQALECLIIEDNYIHNFISGQFGLIGSDWDIEEFKELINEAESIEIGGEQCRKINHGLVVIGKGQDVYFFEADNNKLDLYDKENK